MNYEEIEAARNAPERLERMKPILDRIPPEWGTYLPDPGWDQLLLELDARISETDPDYTIFQAKEKFGTLRFYISLSEGADEHDDAIVGNLVTMAEHKSSHTCEWCGADGAKARHTGWIKTLCDDCAERRHGAA